MEEAWAEGATASAITPASISAAGIASRLSAYLSAHLLVSNNAA